MQELYFNDNFFSSGTTDIMNSTGDRIGTMDLKTMFSASISVYGKEGELRSTGRFRSFSNKWEVANTPEGTEGVLRKRFTFFQKVYEYESPSTGMLLIESPAFSRAYTIKSSGGQLVASFEQTNHWLQSGAFVLQNHSEKLDSYELISIIMGVHSIHKRARNTAAQ
ncbi:hypothetical protein [Paenibacillus sp. HB172176]|uniref:hypothetical protein n=1 Tax=Paenibacillus sp. HB172176 TaxID=2493690 RepID=UPI00143C6B56|nr:hypothetical protein [Paenibacillus sp. HB172176]